MQWRLVFIVGAGLVACGDDGSVVCGPGTVRFDDVCLPGDPDASGASNRDGGASGSQNDPPDAGVDASTRESDAESSPGASGRPGAGGAPGAGGILFGAGGAVGAGGRLETCSGVTFAATPSPKDLYIILDQSASMTEALPGGVVTKWDLVVAGLHRFVALPEAEGTGVAVQYFGLPDECNPAAYATPEVPMNQLPSNAQAIIDSTLGHTPSTLTPTYPALKGALDYLGPLAQASSGQREAAVVLITDGFPTRCQADGTPTGGASIQDLEDLARQYAELDPPIRTFVIGVGEALGNLDSVAEGGGTGDAMLIASGDFESQFLDALAFAIQSPGCQFPLPEDPSNEPIDPSRVQVLYTARSTGEIEQLARVNQAANCPLNQGHGWYYDRPDAPTTIHVCPESCQRLAAGTVEIAVGCASIVGP